MAKSATVLIATRPVSLTVTARHVEVTTVVEAAADAPVVRCVMAGIATHHVYLIVAESSVEPAIVRE